MTKPDGNLPALPDAPAAEVERQILLLRGQRVILASDLARLYGVPTKRLNEQVKRNLARFPDDFMFQLTADEAAALRSQIATSSSGAGSRSQIATSSGWGGPRYRPYAFTEHGVIMAANLLNSDQAVRTSVYVVRAFVRLRQLLATHRELAAKLEELERKLQGHDRQLLALVDAIRSLMAEPRLRRKPPIGYQSEAAARKRRKGMS